MRNFIVISLVLTLIIFSACGGNKKRIETDPVEFDPISSGTDSAVSEADSDEDLTLDRGVGFDSGDAIGETPLAEMTLEEINAAAFLTVIYFEFNKFELTDDAIMWLGENAKWLKQNPTVKVIIEGHCDERGTEEYNLALGEKRANSARDYVVSMGASADRLLTASYGESRPAEPGKNEFAWGKNRRAYFKVYAK